MAPRKHQSPSKTAVWKLVQTQHGVIARRQLLELGLTVEAIQHRISTGRLHPLWKGVYAVGRPRVSSRGRWMAAVLTCGSAAALSHESAAAHWGIRRGERTLIEVSIPANLIRRRRGIRVHRRTDEVMKDVAVCSGIPVTAPARTLIDLAPLLPADQLEAAVNEADKHDLIDPDSLRACLDELPRGPGIGALRRLLDRHTCVLTDSELERRFLPLAQSVGLPPPQTGAVVNGFKVDFYWPQLGLVVETDGLRYHRTPAQQARDRRRDQAHLAAGLTPLRFTHAQVRSNPSHVQRTLATVAARLPRLAAWPGAPAARYG